MDQPTAHLAIDLGAESGRLIVGALSGASGAQRLEVTEVHRFDNVPLRQLGESHWDFESIKREIFIGMKAAAQWCQARSMQLSSVGADTWGVDFALLGPDAYLLGPPRTYRDARHAAGLAAVDSAMSPADRFKLSGVVRSSINTLAQLRARVEADDRELSRATHIAMMADLIHQLLSGELTSELCLASTSELLDVSAEAWNSTLVSLASGRGAQLGVSGPALNLLPLKAPGTVLGPLRFDVATRTRVGQQCMVVLPSSHDTACAVAAVPAAASGDKSTWAFLSSGTWSLLGVEAPRPCLTAAAFEAGLTNERAVGGGFRTQRNIVGLFVLTELRRDLRQRGKNYSYDQLTQLAAAALATHGDAIPAIDINAPPLAEPGNAVEKILALIRAVPSPRASKSKSKPKPAPAMLATPGPGELCLSILKGLAAEYARSIKLIEKLTGRKISVLHIVGGGSKNDLLNQLTATATGLPVIAGPVEATAIGNVLIQAMGLGAVADLRALREIVARSFPSRTFAPSESKERRA